MVRFSEIFKKKKSVGESSKSPTPSTTPPEPVLSFPPKPVQPASHEGATAKEPEPQHRVRVIQIGEEPVPQDDQTGLPSSVTPPIIPPESTKPEREDEEATVLFDKSPVKEISLAEIVRQGNKEKPERAINLYQQLGEIIHNILVDGLMPANLSQIDYAPLRHKTDETINLIITGDRSLLDLAYQYSVDDYLKFHLLNVGVISLYLSKEAGYNKSKMMELGVLAFLHELGVERMAWSDLTVEEEDRDFPPPPIHLRNIQNMGKIILSGLWKEPPVTTGATTNITDYIQLINLVDTYETFCRPKPYRKKMSPQLVVKRLIESGDNYDRNLLKLLIKLIGLYPVGSIVELSCNDIARVIRTNENYPLRPVVQIILDERKNLLPEPKRFDLTTNQQIYIKRILAEEEII